MGRDPTGDTESVALAKGLARDAVPYGKKRHHVGFPHTPRAGFYSIGLGGFDVTQGSRTSALPRELAVLALPSHPHLTQASRALKIACVTCMVLLRGAKQDAGSNDPARASRNQPAVVE